MAEEARPKLSIKTERPAGQHAVPPSPTTLLDNGVSRAAEPAPAPRVSSFAACFITYRVPFRDPILSLVRHTIIFSDV